MTDLLPTHPVSQSCLPSIARVSPGMPLLVILLSVVLVGCSDSHSDEFVAFSELEQVESPAISERQTEQPQSDFPEAPEPKDAVETVSHSIEADAATAVIESANPPQDQAETPSAVSTDTTAEVPAKTPTQAVPQPIKLLIPHRQFRKEGNALRASFDDIDLLKSLNMAPVPIDATDHFPDWLNSLNGAHVRIRGYMRPGFEAEDITQFLFVRDNGECCYGPIPKIYDMIAVELADGESTDLIEGTPFDVEGTFRIEPHADEVELYGLFFIDNGVILE